MSIAKWALEDIEDVGAFVAAIAGNVDAELRWHEREDLHAYLLGECWALHDKWDRSATASFSMYARYLLKLRLVDYVRKERGRTRWRWSGGSYERERPRVLSLDAPAGADGSTLRELVADGSGDPATDSGSAFARLLEDGDRERDRDHAEIRRALAERVAIRAPVNGNGTRRTVGSWLPPTGLVERLEAVADENYRSLSAVITIAVERYLEERKDVEGDVSG